VVAPGVAVESTGLTFGGLFPNHYESVSGTSFAASHVTGAFALLKSAVPGATLEELEAALQETALDLGAPGPDNQYGAGLIDVAAAHFRLVAGQKVTLCHIPPDGLSNAHEIVVSEKALQAHLRNHPGDQVGRCQEDCEGLADALDTDCGDRITFDSNVDF
jgi:hypothetical protein